MRLFLAAELPGPVRDAVVGLRATLQAKLEGWRWVGPEGVHLTLRFLGEVDESVDAKAREAWRRIARESEPFQVCVTQLGRFPPRGTPRVLWVGVGETQPGPALAALATRLEETARELGWEPESRPFRPHLTLARRRRDATRAELTEETTLQKVAGWVRALVLMHSQLGRDGARYTALESFPLGGAPDESRIDGVLG
jgi:2'-5' RNA ligase